MHDAFSLQTGRHGRPDTLWWRCSVTYFHRKFMYAMIRECFFFSFPFYIGVWSVGNKTGGDIISRYGASRVQRARRKKRDISFRQSDTHWWPRKTAGKLICGRRKAQRVMCDTADHAVQTLAVSSCAS